MKTIILGSLFQRYIFIFSILTTCSVISEVNPQNSDRKKQIIEQRQLFNQAIINADINAIATVLADKVILVTGSDSLVFSGKQQQIDLWQSDFSSDNRLIYTRSPINVSLSSGNTMALGSGNWRGSDSSGKGFYGVYSAKWRLVEEVNRWHLEAEIFVTVGELK